MVVMVNRSRQLVVPRQTTLPLVLLLLLLLILVSTGVVDVVIAASAQSTIFNSNKAKDPSNLKGINFVSRFMMPYGPNLYGTPPLQTSADQPYAGYGYGMVRCNTQKQKKTE